MRKQSEEIVFMPCCSNCSFHVRNMHKGKDYCIIKAPDELREITNLMEICPVWEMSIVNSRRIAKTIFEGGVKQGAQSC